MLVDGPVGFGTSRCVTPTGNETILHSFGDLGRLLINTGRTSFTPHLISF